MTVSVPYTDGVGLLCSVGHTWTAGGGGPGTRVIRLMRS